MKTKRPSYIRAVVTSLAAMLKGLKLSGKHYVKGHQRQAPMGIADPEYFQKDQGPITIQYPMQKVPVPDTGRYRLFMETDDCIGCDKCARICPVDCITIETFRADGDLGRTSDGTVKRLHLPVFDIDMGKCMYCGLCTTVCPTECLIMTPVYDFSEYDRDNLIYHFGAYSPEEEGRIRSLTEAALAAKKAAKSAPTETAGGIETPATPVAPVKRRPMIQRGPVSPPSETPVEEQKANSETPDVSKEEKARPRPMMRPIMKRSEEQEARNTELPTENKGAGSGDNPESKEAAGSEGNPENKGGGPEDNPENKDAGFEDNPESKDGGPES